MIVHQPQKPVTSKHKKKKKGKKEEKKEEREKKSSNGEHFTDGNVVPERLSQKGETEKRKERRYKGKCEKKISPRRNSVLLAEIRC